MGYRSDVHMVFYTSSREEDAAVQLWVQENIQPHLEGDTCKPFSLDRLRGYYVVLEDVKYYPDYPAVAAIDAAFAQFSEMDEPNNGYACEFIRIGEESEDTEFRSSDRPDGLLYVSRKVNTDF